MSILPTRCRGDPGTAGSVTEDDLPEQLAADRSAETMVELQIARRGIRDPQILAAMHDVPRDAFVPAGLQEFAYEDTPLPIAAGQTISQPYIVAVMIRLAGIGSGERVLEVGAGSGYAAAVMAQIADKVFAIERHGELVEQAGATISRLGYENVHLRCGDGTKGWPEEAPFDAIIVSAGGPRVPQALQAQLARGGRLVIPVGNGQQRLVRVTREDDGEFTTEEFEPVNFVPLVGEQGWPSGELTAKPGLPGSIASAAIPLPAPDDPGFAEIADRWANKKIVMLGESTHGTQEFYAARAEITKRLIQRHGFTVVAVEADWPDAAAVDRFVRHRVPRRTDRRPFGRFPTWMWRNDVVYEFLAWMKHHNETEPQTDRLAGFYGLDLYNMQGAIAAVLAYLDDVDPEAASVARERYSCLTPWQHDPAAYGRAVLTEGYRRCEKKAVAQCLAFLQREIAEATDENGNELFEAAQNARLIASAEKYYRRMYYGGAEAWNLRDSHMFETLLQLLEQRGPNTKAVVWAHNSHIGDASETEMGRVRDEHNIGQLARDRFGSDAALVGFGTHCGTVAAASEWNGPMEIKPVKPSIDGSYEQLCHETGLSRFLLEFGEGHNWPARLEEPRLERFIGVIYRPENERQSHYMQAVLPRQFDAFVWFDRTRAISRADRMNTGDGPADTYPSGL